jgi:hypothetical protein
MKYIESEQLKKFILKRGVQKSWSKPWDRDKFIEKT